jgi:hypothetical protein
VTAKAPTAPAPPTAEPPPVPPKAPRPRIRAWLVIVAIIVVIALVVATLLLAVLDAGQREDRGPGRPVSLSAPLGGRQAAVFDLASGATAMTIRSTDLGDELYRISAREPRVATEGDRISLQTEPSAAVDVQLSTRVRWTVRLSGGATEQNVDMSAGGLAAVELAGGASRIELTLPRPDGTLPVRLTQGADQFLVHGVAGIPAQVRIGSGAGLVTLGTETHSGVAAGTLYKPDGWDRAANRYDIDAVAGLSHLTLD